MKKLIITLCCACIFIFAGCKKDIDLSVEKTFAKSGESNATASMLPGTTYYGTTLTLKPNGDAYYVIGGDAIDNGTYKRSGNKLVVTTGNSSTTFKIVSETELSSDGSWTLIK